MLTLQQRRDEQTGEPREDLAFSSDPRWHRNNAHLDDQVLLAAWAFKTAATIEYGNPRSAFFTTEELQEFRRTLLPPEHVAIWAAKYVGIKSAQTATLTHQIIHHVKPPIDYRIRTITFSVGQLALQIVGIRNIKTSELQHVGRPIVRRIPKGWLTGLIRVWPMADTRIRHWPPPQPLNDPEMRALSDR